MHFGNYLVYCLLLIFLFHARVNAQTDTIAKPGIEVGVDIKPMIVRLGDDKQKHIKAPFGLSLKRSYKKYALRTTAQWTPKTEMAPDERFSSFTGRLGAEYRYRVHRLIYVVFGADVQARHLSQKVHRRFSYTLKSIPHTFHSEQYEIIIKSKEVGGSLSWGVLMPFHKHWLVSMQGRFDYFEGRVKGTMESDKIFNGVNARYFSNSFVPMFADCYVAYRF